MKIVPQVFFQKFAYSPLATISAEWTSFLMTPTRSTHRAAGLILVFLVFFSCFNYVQITIRISRRRDLMNSNTIPATVHDSRYCIAYNLTRARKSFRDDHLEPISLTTHCTSLYLHLLEEQVKSWDGPISLALFIDRGSAAAVQYLVNLHKCDRAYTDKLSLHVVYKLSAFQERCQPLPVVTQTMSCRNLTQKYRKSFLQYLMPPFGIYPINVMRNVARRGAPSSIQLISDIEMIFR
ncbi:hypothetical protein Y032_0152g2858 [Ancylostoma ceylanicum]|uniref:Uncharacterized protein n=2 Tax=Ancylostoma ceylanicum TaxID=53326 RepID=A0A016SZN7_9BILA|nr:hypothetical protein Y032_0152g2858 [Ancylostoma ceylanicum]